MPRFRIVAIFGVIVFGIAAIALAIIGLLTAIAGVTRNGYFLASGVCAVACAIAFATRRSPPPPS